MRKIIFGGATALALAAALAASPALADSQDLLNGIKAQHGGKLPIPLPGSFTSQNTTVFDDIANWIGGDLTAAETLAVQNPDVQDWTGYACWKAAESFSAVLKAHPIPITLKAASDAEALRLAMSAAKSLCQNAACQTISGDLLGGIAQMGLGMPPPVTLQTLCAKIPSITLGTMPVGFVTPTPAGSASPVPVAAPSPTPSATPTPSPSASP